jgi:hypothetical protein
MAGVATKAQRGREFSQLARRPRRHASRLCGDEMIKDKSELTIS